jgi:ketosteroid isomerase-like protein
MKMIRTIVLALVALVFGTATPIIAKDAKTEVARQGELWNQAYDRSDWTAMRALYTDDAWLMTDKAPLAGSADAIINYLRRFKDMGAKVKFRFENEDVSIQGKLGVVVAKYWMTAELPGRPAIKTAGRSLLIYKKQGKRWLLWRDMDNTTPDVKVE